MIATDREPDLDPSSGARAWDLMSQIWKSCKPYVEQVANSAGLTPQQLIALKMMGEYGTMAMSELASYLGCDASNVTAIVDKLESRGFVERRNDARDRRVKSLVMTADGADAFARIKKSLQQPPVAIHNLTTADQEELCAIFQRALASLEAQPA